jgi:hypothetical protein
MHYNSTNIHQKVTPLIFLRSMHQGLSNGIKMVLKIDFSGFRKKYFFRVISQALAANRSLLVSKRLGTRLD